MPDHCAKCGSRNVIPPTVASIHRGTTSLSSEQLFVGVEVHPDAVLRKGTVRAIVGATVCGDCGHLELAVDDFRALWDAYQQRR